MQRDDWLTCTRLNELLDFLGHRTTDRKMRLFACACLRDVWPRFTDWRLWDFVERVEKSATDAECQEMIRTVWPAIASTPNPSGMPDELVHAVAGIAFNRRDEPPWYGDIWGWSQVRDVVQTVLRLSADPEAEQLRMCGYLHCLYHWPNGYLFNYWPAVPPAVLAWNDGTVRRIAQAIYDERAFDRLPILADALEEAGYEGDHLLQHCRDRGPHVRGCWAIDRILDRE